MKFRQWKEGGEGQGADAEGPFLMGEVPDDLALVIEKETAEFEIG